MQSLHANKMLAIVALGVSFCIAGVQIANAQTTPAFNITSTFNFIQDQGANDGGFLSGVSDNFGIFVSPVGT